MPFDTFKPLDHELDLVSTEDASGTTVPAAQNTEEDDWDFWNSEYWIVRDRPPYRV